MSDALPQLNRLLDLVEAEMRLLELWSEQPPSDRAMASQQPFCHDSMPLEHWLQWIMLPRFRQIIEAGGTLPPRCNIAPIVELTYAEQSVDASQLLALMRQVDQLINDLPGGWQ